MRYEEISPTLRMFLGNREAFRKLGFSADDLYCTIAMSLRHGCLSCFVELKTREGKEFSVECGAIDDADNFQAEYEKTSNAINAGQMTQEDLDRIWQESECFCNKVDFATALVMKGITT